MINKCDALTVGISTMSHRLAGIGKIIASFAHDTQFIISVQKDSIEHNELNFESWVRQWNNHKNVKIMELISIGVSISRNAVLQETQTKFLWFCDDDVSANIDGLEKIIDYLNANREVSLIAGITASKHSIRGKKYSQTKTILNKYNTAKFGTTDIIVRVDDIRENQIWFDERFGAGKKWYMGDEYIFICDALQKKLHCHFIPEITCFHEQVSSGINIYNFGRRESQKAVFKRVFGYYWPIIWILFDLKRCIKMAINYKQ